MNKSELDKDRQAKLDSIKAKQIKQFNPDIEPVGVIHIKPVTAKEKWDNFWFHYKLHFWGIVAGIITIALVLYYIIFPVKFDAKFSIISCINFLGTEEHFTKNIAQILPDYDNDGKVELEVLSYQLPFRPEDPRPSEETIIANQNVIVTNIASRNHFLYLLTEDSYKYLTQTIGLEFRDLSDLSDSKNINGDKYNITGTKLETEFFDFGNVLDGFFFCIADYESYSNKKEKEIKQFNQELDLLKEFIKIQ
ncbi:MAG: hypothetical protein RSE93_04130 [Oscillospiraceae bacterium]